MELKRSDLLINTMGRTFENWKYEDGIETSETLNVKQILSLVLDLKEKKVKIIKIEFSCVPINDRLWDTFL